MEKYSRPAEPMEKSVYWLTLSLKVSNVSDRGTCMPAQAVRVDPELSHTQNMAALLPYTVSSILDVQALTWMHR